MYVPRVGVSKRQSPVLLETDKSFLVLFFKKELLLASLASWIATAQGRLAMTFMAE
jgi:hypothetical protein